MIRRLLLTVGVISMACFLFFYRAEISSRIISIVEFKDEATIKSTQLIDNTKNKTEGLYIPGWVESSEGLGLEFGVVVEVLNDDVILSSASGLFSSKESSDFVGKLNIKIYEMESEQQFPISESKHESRVYFVKFSKEPRYETVIIPKIRLLRNRKYLISFFAPTSDVIKIYGYQTPNIKPISIAGLKAVVGAFRGPSQKWMSLPFPYIQLKGVVDHQ